MNSGVAIRQIIEEKLLALAGTYKVAWDNAHFKETPGIPHLACTFDNTYSENIAFGCQREHLLIEIQVFTPFGEGSNRNLQIADSIKDGFSRYSYGYLTCTTSRIARIGQVKEWHQRDVLIDAYYDNHV